MAEPEDREPKHARAHAAKHARRRRPWRFAVAPLVGLLLVLGLTLVVVGLPGPAHPRAVAAQATSLDLTSATPAAPCGAFGILGRLLGACGASAGSDDPAPTASCNLLAQLLGLCTMSPDSGDSGSGATPPSTTTTTTSPPPTTTTTAPAPDPVPGATLGTGGPCAGTTPPIAAPTGGWTCTFDDEFDGTSLDTTKWQPQLTATSGYTTGSTQAKVCYVDNPQTISESGGALSLSIQRTNTMSCPGLNGLGGSSHYQGGMVSSYQLFSQEFGYFQVRAAMPSTAIPGLQETLWLYPENQKLYGAWPDSGEIDYGEFYSQTRDDDYPVLHYPGSTGDPNSDIPTGCSAPGASAAGQYNTYAMSWTPTTITAYFNGVPCITDVYAPYVASPDKAPEPFNQPFFLAFTSALGMGNDGVTSNTPTPATTKIDWVRVWQYG